MTFHSAVGSGAREGGIGIVEEKRRACRFAAETEAAQAQGAITPGEAAELARVVEIFVRPSKPAISSAGCARSKRPTPPLTDTWRVPLRSVGCSI